MRTSSLTPTHERIARAILNLERRHEPAFVSDLVRNLGYPVKRFTTANFDFIRHYRPATNVVHRPTLEGGKGFNFTGHHELMLPLLAAAVLDALDQHPKQEDRPKAASAPSTGRPCGGSRI